MKPELDESLLKELRAVARDEETAEADEALWVAHAAGTLTSAQREALEARAESDDEARHLRTLTAPHSSDLESRILAALPRSTKAETAKVLPLRRRGQRLLYVGTPLLAAAAALLLWVRAPSGGSHPDLPAYAMNIEGADMHERGSAPNVAEGERLTLTVGARVDIVAHPTAAVSEPVVARPFLVRAGEVRALGVTARVAPSGAVRFEGGFDSVFGDARGDWDLVLLIVPAAVSLTTAEATSAAREGRAPVGGALLRRPLRLVAAH